VSSGSSGAGEGSGMRAFAGAWTGAEGNVGVAGGSDPLLPMTRASSWPRKARGALLVGTAGSTGDP
jgi:hypothetical protein